ncbi:glycosyltransferase, partial [Actinoallomurus acaciae]
ALEAMACGVPVVVSSVGGHLDTVVDGVTGLYVPPLVPSALAGRLRRLLTDPRLGPSLAAAAAVRARERYSWSRIAAETEAVYNRVIDGRADAMVTTGDVRS